MSQLAEDHKSKVSGHSERMPGIVRGVLGASAFSPSK
jgi:hypothetical protein